MKFNLKKIFNNFMADITQANVGLERLEKFCADAYVFAAKDWDSYCNQFISKNRVLISLALKLSTIPISIKYILCLIMGKSMRIWLADGTYMLGNPSIMYAMLIVGNIVCQVTDILFFYNEFNNSLFMISFFNDIKNKRNSNRLSAQNSQKYDINMNICSKFILKQSSYSLAIAVIAIFFIPSIIANSNEPHPSLLFLIFWFIITVIWAIHLFHQFMANIIFWYSFLFYVKYQFKEVNQQIETSLKYRNFNLLFNAILRHNSIEKNVKELNKMYKIIAFVLYIATTVDINLQIIGLQFTIVYFKHALF